ncbi:MAG TPA: N-acetyltransferase [Myxococcaceae bacterium]|jgi:GNAT superfamily N-acetyltransferase|nr:N-acetyltransferase [Myxococcaceae bacterium]
MKLAGGVSVSPVRTYSERDQFIRFQLEHYRGDPNFVPPIVAERRDFLDRRTNPFFKHARVELLLAHRGGRVVGRIAAVDDPNYNQFHNTEAGFFGMFESVDDRQVAGALFDAAASWVRARGMKEMLGPVNLSTNHDCGLLVEGFDRPPAMMMPYNPRHYPALFEANGLRKAKDLWMWELSTSVAPPEKVLRVEERLRAEAGVSVRALGAKDLTSDIRRIKRIYNAMLERNWGFVPMSEEEFDFIAQRLRPLVLLRPALSFIVEVHGEPVAFSITLPDSNVGLKAAKGYLTTFGLPLGLARLAWATRANDRLRVLMLGIKSGYRRRGIDALLYTATLRAARELGYASGELGWTLEDNDLINRALESMGARRFKTYRIYERKV